MQSQFSDKFISKNEVEVPSTTSEVRYSGPAKGDTNNHHVVPLGILMVLCTVYLVAAGARYYFEPGVAALDLYSCEVSLDEGYPETIEDMPVNNLRCAKLEIFGKETAQESDSTQSGNQMAKPPQSRAGKRTRNGPAGSGASKRPRGGKATVESNRKKQEQPKKSNTAEPIIYLFALVFIYLLLKAASDINQHYKSQNKGDKRLRRCSLQSYAQIHKQDRRASKGISPKTLPKF